jgi:hypothetical protein
MRLAHVTHVAIDAVRHQRYRDAAMTMMQHMEAIAVAHASRTGMHSAAQHVRAFAGQLSCMSMEAWSTP